MCTVSYVPLEKGYVLTSNRDENPARKTMLPKQVKLPNGMVVYSPIDALKGGSWIATDEKGRTVCLLNGAFTKHQSKEIYRKSRGQFVLDAFVAKDFSNYLSSVFLEEIEPFTLLLIEPNKVQQLIWDGSKKHIKTKNPKKPHLWSSVTLYTTKDHAKKETYFFKTLAENKNSPHGILKIHGKDDKTPFIFNHTVLQTVSITQIIYEELHTKINYFLKDDAYKSNRSLTLIGI